jgi:hypothetical protein
MKLKIASSTFNMERRRKHRESCLASDERFEISRRLFLLRHKDTGKRKQKRRRLKIETKKEPPERLSPSGF